MGLAACPSASVLYGSPSACGLAGWRLAGWLAAFGWLPNWLAGCLPSWLAGWLAGRLAGWLTGWLADWLPGCLAG